MKSVVKENKINCKWLLTCMKNNCNARGGQVHPCTSDALLQECRYCKQTHKMSCTLLLYTTGISLMQLLINSISPTCTNISYSSVVQLPMSAFVEYVCVRNISHSYFQNSPKKIRALIG